MEKERLVTAQWVLERNLAWIAAAEVKVGVLCTVDTGMLGALGAMFFAEQHRTPWLVLLALLASGCLAAALACAAGALLPRVNGPNSSLLFFGCVTRLSAIEYGERFRTASDADLLRDWTDQIHRNAEIAGIKHRWVRRAMGWSLLAVLPWTIALGLLGKVS